MSKAIVLMCACMVSRFSRVRLCTPMDSSPPGSPGHRIFQARALEWGAISFSQDLAGPRIRLVSPAVATVLPA